MFRRPMRMLLSTCVVCGIFSLAIFYLYTDRYNSKKMVFDAVYKTRIKKIQKKVKLKNERLKLPSTSVNRLELLYGQLTSISPKIKPVTLSTLMTLPQQKGLLNTLNGGDAVDELIQASLEKNEKRSHGDGDEPEPTKLTVDYDRLERIEDQDESQAPTVNMYDVNPKPEQNIDNISPKDNEDNDLELCPARPPALTGPLFVNQNIPKMIDLNKHISEEYGGWVMKGGAWKPTHCKARVKMALIVPFRKRYEQLAIFVRHMHPMLKRQEINYRIIIVEQSGRTPFNRAILFNIGYKEALKFQNFNCFIFHDVDLIPEDDRNLYTCPTSPRHMSVAVDKFNYRLPYPSIFGGAGAFLRKDFEEINGFSNKFWGWGGEDDDLYQRVVSKGHHLSRPPLNIGRYKMIKIHHHQSSKADPNSAARIKNARIRMLRDGLNSLKYKVLKLKEEPMYTIVTIEVDPKDFKGQKV